MNNYYEIALKEIKEHISESRESEALRMISEELSMPYIPQDFKNELEVLRDALVVNKPNSMAFFTNIDDIKEALNGDDAMRSKALLSLENMNLRPYVEDLVDILRNHEDDFVKRVILMISMDQELSYDAFLVLNGIPHSLNISEIDDPFQSEHYINLYQSLIDTFESYDPSFLVLAQEVLNLAMMDAYPFVDMHIQVDDIIEKTQHYLNQG